MAETRQISHKDKSFRVVPGRNGVFWEAVSRGAWEPETYRIFDRFIDRGGSYIDMGSWIGPTLLYGCQLARDAYGIEPDPIAYAELSTNVACNQPMTSNVRLFNGCITPRSGKVAFGSRDEGGDSTSSMLFAREKTSWQVDGMSFDDFVRSYHINDCKFIKMDIEGGEYSVLPTMVPYLREHRPTLYLSLHPCFLGPQGDAGLVGKVRRIPPRFANMIKVIKCIFFYKYIYNNYGERITPYQMLKTFRAGTSAVVVTDLEWGMA